jgi:sigma-B regulation protein RsbU (phosphoserine phosphatase)
MASTIASTNHSFSFLKNSPEFLQILLEEISSCILLLNKELMLYAFNEPLRTIFSDKPDEVILFRKCGEVIGCAYAVEEQKECGFTTRCEFCELREMALKTCYTHESSGKRVLSREFYRTDDQKTLKHLRFSTRYFPYDGEGFVIVIIDDVTDIINGKVNWSGS